MKKTNYAVAVIAAVLMVTGCASKPVSESKEISKNVRASATENNTEVIARNTKIIDWQDRTIGAKVNPEWLLGIVRGNGTKYVQMYGLTDEYSNHKWFVSSAQNSSLANAQTIAETEVVYRLAAEMANTINATVGTNLSDGQKDAIRTICAKVQNVTLTGVGNRGSYWQLERTTDEYGNERDAYNYYALYSCDSATYNKLLNIYMINLLKSNELDEETVSAVKKNAQEILNASQRVDEREQLKKEREWKAQLVHEQTERVMAREETLRKQSESFAQAVANNTQSNVSLNMKNAGNAEMDPALAALIGEM